MSTIFEILKSLAGSGSTKYECDKIIHSNNKVTDYEVVKQTMSGSTIFESRLNYAKSLGLEGFSTRYEVEKAIAEQPTGYAVNYWAEDQYGNKITDGFTFEVKVNGELIKSGDRFPDGTEIEFSAAGTIGTEFQAFYVDGYEWTTETSDVANIDGADIEIVAQFYVTK